jgi:hypothetical protein
MLCATLKGVVGGEEETGACALLEAMVLAEDLGSNGAERREIAKDLLFAAFEAAEPHQRAIWKAAQDVMDKGLDRSLAAAMQDTDALRSHLGCVARWCLAFFVDRRERIRKAKQVDIARTALQQQKDEEAKGHAEETKETEGTAV